MPVMRSSQGSLMHAIVVALTCLLACATSACSAYDANLVQRDSSSASGVAPKSQRAVPAQQSQTGVIEADQLEQLGPDETRVTLCGDGLVTGVEKCDVAILEGGVGACPTACPDIEPCVPRVLNGSACQAACELRPILCQSGDGCCAGNCTRANDSDCSPTCGDGVLQPSETCEEGSEAPCPADDLDCDDGDPCTRDQRLGSPDACNARCVHVRIAELGADDGCCPDGANANTDLDCHPACGNGVHEANEECDGAEGCGPDCKLTLQPDQITCLMSAGEDACERCACEQCVETELACWSTSALEANRLCREVQACARATSCFLNGCYCGQALDAPTCAVAANGPCMAQIEAAAGTTDPLLITAMKWDTATPLGKAYAADACRVQQCQDVCR